MKNSFSGYKWACFGFVYFLERKKRNPEKRDERLSERAAGTADVRTGACALLEINEGTTGGFGELEGVVVTAVYRGDACVYILWIVWGCICAYPGDSVGKENIYRL